MQFGEVYVASERRLDMARATLHTLLGATGPVKQRLVGTAGVCAVVLVVVQGLRFGTLQWC